jgi:hypothetical protein
VLFQKKLQGRSFRSCIVLPISSAPRAVPEEAPGPVLLKLHRVADQ